MILAHWPAIDLMVDPVCQVALILHLRGEVPKDLTQEIPDRICDIADTGKAYGAYQLLSVDCHGVDYLGINLEVQYASCGSVVANLHPDHPGVPGVGGPNPGVVPLCSACGRAEAGHQVVTGVGECPHPGMTVCLISHTQYNTMSGAIPEK